MIPVALFVLFLLLTALCVRKDRAELALVSFGLAAFFAYISGILLLGYLLSAVAN
jgi:uncharacterized membrane protein